MTRPRNKLAVSLAIGLLGIFLAIPALIGRTIQSMTEDSRINNLPGEFGDILDITPTIFNRGWFTSNATIDVGYKALDQLNGQPVILSLDMKIRHGPILFTPKGVRFGLSYAEILPSISGLDPEEVESAQNKDDFDPVFYLFAGFDNSLRLDVNLGEYGNSRPGAPFYLEQLSGNLTIGSNGFLMSEIESGLASFANADGSISLELASASLNATIEGTSLAIVPGSATLQIMQFRSSAPLPLSVREINSAYELGYIDNRQTHLQMSQILEINELQWDIPLESLRWQLQVNRINRTLLERYSNLLRQIQSTGTYDLSAFNTDFDTLSDELELILIQEPLELDIDLKLSAFEGEHELGLHMEWPGIPSAISSAGVVLEDILNLISVSIVIKADESAMSQSPLAPAIEQYLQEGYLNVANGQVTADAKLSEGTLTINDQEISLDQIF